MRNDKYLTKDNLYVFAGVVALGLLLAFLLWWTVGSAKQVTVTIVAKEYKLPAAEDQNWQVVDRNGVRYAMTFVGYQRTPIGATLRCRRTGHSYSVPVLPDVIYDLSFCRRQA